MSKLPLIVMLHGAGADENRYMDMNDQQMLRLAEQHGYVLVSPLGYSPLGAYGTPLRLPAVFGQPEIAAKQRAAGNARSGAHSRAQRKGCDQRPGDRAERISNQPVFGIS